MSLTTLDEDLAVHQKLDDEPNDVGGLTAQEMKEKFDHASLAIQAYLNEVHLPEVAQELDAALASAKEYADKKVVDVGAGDMAKAVYDPQRRETDVYQYAEDKAREVLGGAARFGYVMAGKCWGTVYSEGETDLMFDDMVDPRGLWNDAEGCFVAPEGAEGMLLTAEVTWGRETFASCYLSAKVNGEERLRRTGPDDTSGNYIRETVLLPLTVTGGDKVTLTMGCTHSGTSKSEVSVTYCRAEIIL